MMPPCLNFNKIIVAIFISTGFFTISKAQNFNSLQQKWSDSLFNSLSDDERIGQLFMVAAYSNKDEKHFLKIDSLISIQKIGGLIFFQGGPKREAILTNRYQALTKVPLLIGMDAEWGLGMRLDSTMSFPRQMTIGAIDDPSYTYKMGAEVAKHCKRMGIHINFAPVVDVNNNPDNPVIGIRSFGENKEKVAQNGIAYMKGMQQNGIATSAKHFPGHGDTDADSHHSLPVINHDKKRMNELELYPFRKLIKDSLMSVMVAHIHLPAYDKRPNMATTLSPAVVTDLLKKKMDFKGLVFTDALNMKGVAKFFSPGELEVLALQAGNDVLLFPEDVPVAIVKIKEAIADGRLDKKDLEERVKKILKVKYWAGLHHYQPIDTTHLYSDLQTNASKAVRHEMYEKAITVLKNKDMLLPFKNIDHQSFASVAIGLNKNTEYQAMLDNYAECRHFSVLKDAKDSAFNRLIDSLSGFSRVIVSLHDLNNRKKENYGISDKAIDFIKKLQQKTNVIVVHFGNVYATRLLDFSNILVCAYEDNETTRKIIPQSLFGAISTQGKLPVAVAPSFKVGEGLVLQPAGRVRYCYAENEGIASEKFYKVDSIINEAIKDGSTPGAQLQLVYKNAVIYQKCFGYQTYDKSVPVTNKTVYDIASVTKTAATMQSIMFLYDWNKFDPDKFASDYLPELKGTNKEKLILRDMLVHEAGLVSYIEYWRRTFKNGQPEEKYYSRKKSAAYPLQVSQNLYTTAATNDSLWRWTIHSPLLAERSDTGCYSYKYSDLTFYFMKRIAEKELGQPLDQYLDQNIYKPLGLRAITFKPLEKMPVANIPPTEEDKTFRNMIVRGTVHDQSAAMVGGVAGHAGIFSTANDLAVLGQMNLNGGYYGGVSYFKESTIRSFTRQQYSNNRRALGWDRPFPPEEISLASPSAFGHTGFTGTAWWMDPQYQMVFVLLTNRTYPFADNKRFTTNSVRTKVLNAIYEVLKEKNPGTAATER